MNKGYTIFFLYEAIFCISLIITEQELEVYIISMNISNHLGRYLFPLRWALH